MNDLEHVSAYLAENIITLRKRSELSQERLADKAGIPRSTITNMESGAGNPSLTNLCKLAAALGVSIEELLSRPRNETSLLKASQVPVQNRSSGKVLVIRCAPPSSLDSAEIGSS